MATEDELVGQMTQLRGAIKDLLRYTTTGTPRLKTLVTQVIRHVDEFERMALPPKECKEL